MRDWDICDSSIRIGPCRRKNCVSRNRAQTLAHRRVTGRRPTLGCGSTHRLPECGRERPRRTRRHPDRARLGAVGTSPTIARHDERHRESAQSHAPCTAQRETLAGGDDGAALGGRQRARSREEVPSGERMQRYAGPRRCPPGTRRAVRTRGVVNDGRVVVNRTAAEFQQRTGHPPNSSP